jgi:hypothetical protein
MAVIRMNDVKSVQELAAEAFEQFSITLYRSVPGISYQGKGKYVSGGRFIGFNYEQDKAMLRFNEHGKIFSRLYVPTDFRGHKISEMVF